MEAQVISKKRVADHGEVLTGKREGDALTLKTVGDPARRDGYIVFSEWSPVNGSMLKRRDFTFHGLLAHEGMKELPLFSDLDEDVFIPTLEKEYLPVHFLELGGTADGRE